MAVITRRIQPQGDVRLDYSNPLAKGLVVASVLGNSRNRDAARESAHTVIGTKVVAVPDGLATGFGTTWGVSNSDKIVTGYAEPINDRSYFVRARRDGNGGGNLGRLFDKLSGLNGQGLFYESNTITYLEISSSGGELRSSFPSPSIGEWFDVLVTRKTNGSNFTVDMYLNGALAATVNKTGVVRDSAETPITIGNRADNIRGWNGLIACGYVWDRGLSASDAYDLSQNPWRIFQPNKRRVWAVSAAPTINNGSLSWTEASDIQSASGTSKSSGSAAFSEASDLFSATGSSKSSATANWSEGDDALAGQANAIATALAAWIENDDVLAASVTTISAGVVSGSANWTEASDISAALASAKSSGAVYWPEDSDVSSAVIVITSTGNASWTEADETSSAVVTLSISGSAEWIEASDVLSAFVFSGEAEIIKPNQKLTIFGKQRLRNYIGEARKRDFAGKSRMRETQ